MSEKPIPGLDPGDELVHLVELTEEEVEPPACRGRVCAPAVWRPVEEYRVELSEPLEPLDDDDPHGRMLDLSERDRAEVARLVGQARRDRGEPVELSEPVDDAEQRPDRELDACREPGPQLLPAPRVHADLTAASALAVGARAATRAGVEVALAERERLLDAKPAAPEHDDQRPLRPWSRRARPG